MATYGRILVIDDDAEMRGLLQDFLTNSGYEVEVSALASEAFEKIRKQKEELGHCRELDLIISDIQMPEMDGIELVERLHRFLPEIPVILVTAFGGVDSAIEATKKGAFDYLTKPFKLTELGVRVSRAVQMRRLKLENQILKTEVKRSWSFSSMIGKSKAIKSVFDLIERVADAKANILITGESGTGKEMVARAIHERGSRANSSFVAINCTAIPESLLESELFGHAKGSFTGAIQKKKGLFEEAHGGTIFLDEIGDMDLGLQAKLLRVIQERRIRPVGENEYKDIDVRIISATHKDLVQAVKEGRFREDLYYRLSVVPIHIPSLKERKEDIPLLANFFLNKYSAANSSPVQGISQGAMSALMDQSWPGNVRELENLIERLVVLSSKTLIEVEDLPLSTTAVQEPQEDFYGSAISDLPTLAQLEKRYIEYVLQKSGDRKEKASQLLGINRRTLYRKEREYGWVVADPATESLMEHSATQ